MTFFAHLRSIAPHPKTWDGSRPSRSRNPKQAIAVANVPAAHRESVRLNYRLFMKNWLSTQSGMNKLG
jgi:hypothetical protein